MIRVREPAYKTFVRSPRALKLAAVALLAQVRASRYDPILFSLLSLRYAISLSASNLISGFAGNQEAIARLPS